MSEPKYKTFRDLRSVSKESVKEETPSTLSTPSTPSKPSISSTPSKPRTPSTAIAPERDFQRVPNSVTREAMPQGLFRGKSKQVYDYLYHQTRGAMTPKRSVRKSRKEILRGSGLGSMVTVDAAIDHLRTVGLLAVRPAVGSLIGNEYEVFTPEETTTRIPSTTSTTSLTQKVDNLVVPESGSTSTTQTLDSTGNYGTSKTKIKDKDHIDDDAALALLESLRQAERDVTGKNSSNSSQWKELADVLIAELRIASGRTTVSNVPAFLAEHLRRRLWKIDKKQAAREGKELPDQVATTAQKNPVDCPDCNGSGWWYPNGTEKGVAKCKHAGLNVLSPPIERL
jgi:hypothetical protein